MDRTEAQERMQEIQRIMERATLYTLLPGGAAVIGGILVLAGCIASALMFHFLAHPGVQGAARYIDFATLLYIPVNWQFAFCGMWFAIGLLGVAEEVILTARAAKRQGTSPTARPARVAAFSITPSVIVAMVLTIKFLIPVQPLVQEVQYIVPVWMMLYGTGVYTAGLFSIRPPRILGLAFIAMGALSIMFLQHIGVVTAALSFGLFHIVFGVYIMRKRGEAAAP